MRQVYNALVWHAIAQLRPASTVSKIRLSQIASYNIAGFVFSLDEIENGLLRGNRCPPSKLSPVLPKGDLRLALRVPEAQLDPRIHFALNCGALGCPAVRFYTAERLEHQLSMAALAFCDSPQQVALDEARQAVVLSKIFLWYRPDFAADGTDRSLLERVAQFLGAERRAVVLRMLAKGAVSVTYAEYDWTTNSH